MKFSKLLLTSFYLFLSISSYAENSEIYNPYLISNPNKIDSFGGYCKNSVDERKLWSEINKYAKSALLVFPKIPPEQKSYLDGEFNSGNDERAMNVTGTSFYKISAILDQIANIERLSSNYLLNQDQLSITKKMEFIGRVLSNVNSDNISYDDFNFVSSDLKSKGYYISVENLRRHWGLTRAISRSFISHLICYGEK